MQQQHFMPRQPGKHEFTGRPAHLFEGTKQAVLADMRVSESCFSKCNFNFNAGGADLSASETACLGRCFSKYVDSQLLLEKEITVYTSGNPRV